MANTDLQLNTTITLKDEFSSQMGGFASSVGRLHGMLESLNTTMNKISHIASTPLNNNFSNGLASIGRSAHRANIELNILNSTLTRTVGLASRMPSGGATAGASAGAVGSTRGLLGGIRGLFGGITKGIENVFSGISRKFSSLFSRSNSPLNSPSLDNNLPSFNGFSDLLKNNLVTALVGAFGSMAVLKQSQKLFEDATKQMTVHQRLSHLKFVENGDIGINELKDKIFGAAMRSKTNYLDFATMIQSVGARAGGAFGSSGELIQFTEQLQKIFTTDKDMDASSRISTTVQLSRALLKGQMESRELNQVLYNTPSLIDLIAKALKKPETEIYKLASEGKITANIVKNAVFNNIDEINKKFLDMPDGWGEVMIRINNYAQHAFQGVYQKITDIFSAKRIQKLGEKIAPIFYKLAGILEKIIDGLTVAIDWVLKNIDNLLNAFIELGGVVTVLGTIFGLITAINLVIASGPIGYILITITALEALIVQLNEIYGTSYTLFEFIGFYLGYIMGVLENIGTWLFNVCFRAIVKIHIGFLKISNQISSASKILSLAFQFAINKIKISFINSMASIFTSIQNLAKNTVSVLLDVINFFLEPLEKGINTLIGVSNKIGGTKYQEVHFTMNKNNNPLMDYLEGNKGQIAWAKQELLEKLNQDNTKISSNAIEELNTLDQLLKELDNFKDTTIKEGSLPYADLNAKANEWADKLKGFGINLNSPNSNILKWDKIGTGFDKSSVLNDIKKNTDDIRNNSDFSKYLRELADRNSINHFTSPTYSINLENQNTINSQADYNGFVTRIVDEIKEALLNSPQSIPYGGAYA